MRISLSLILLFLINISYSQTQRYLQGYNREVDGKRFGYHSPFPDVNEALIVRGLAEYDPIVWETEQIPRDYQDDFVTFLWLFAMDVTDQPVKFTLSVNDLPLIGFSSSSGSTKEERSFEGGDGSLLVLNTTMIDRHSDQMGFATLRVPVSHVGKGQPVRISIAGNPQNSNSWFMTYKTAVSAGISLKQNKVVIRDKEGPKYSISVDFIHMGESETAVVSVGKNVQQILLKAGYNTVELHVPAVKKPTTFKIGIRIAGGREIKRDIRLAPVRPWYVYLVQHTHTDIGYTRPQTEVLPEHLRFIDHALDYCDQTDHLPDDARFRWTIETSWSVREYLKSRPRSQIDRLLQRIKEGRIEVTGMFFNFSEIIDEATLVNQTRALKKIQEEGIEVKTAMQNDVNGIAWSLVDYFSGTDVKYLNMGIHAHRARKPFNKPTPFWWQSPAGNRLLAYRSEHYQHANSLSLTTGQQDVFRTNLSTYLTSLEERNYPYNRVSLQFSGYVTDNSPPSPKACTIIDAWNKKCEWPKLRSALARDFMEYLEKEHKDDIPIQEVAWPDWWTDGVGAAANETKVTLQTQARISAITTVFSMAKILGIEPPENVHKEIQDVYDGLLFFDEHTHGAAESVTDPLAQNTINQWGMKAANAWDAAKRASALGEKAMAFFEPAIVKSSKPTILVVNGLNWKRSGMVYTFIDYEVLPPGVPFDITDSNGNKVPFQRYDARPEGAYFGLWVEDIPPVGFKTLKVNLGTGQMPPKPVNSSGIFENQYYRIELADKGVIKTWYDKELAINLLDPEDTLSMGQVIYERLANRHAMERLTSTTRDTVYKPLDLKRNLLSEVKLLRRVDGEIYSSLFLNGSLPDCADYRGVDIEIRLFHMEKKLEIHYRLHKLNVTNPEGLYVAFPFKLIGGNLAFEAQGGVVYPGKNQLEGSASDWNTIQNFASVRNDEQQILFSSHATPLVQFGDLNIGRYYYRLQPKSNHIYSWVLNNYWVTNFRASQMGELRWMYSLHSSDDSSDSYATRFGWSEKMPLLSRVIMPSFGAAESNPVSKSLVSLEEDNVLLVDMTPSGDGAGIILHLRELDGKFCRIDIASLLKETGARSLTEVNVLEEPLQDLSDYLILTKFETKFIKLCW